jgi:conjugal transfer pilus assembly protein TraK
MSPIPLPTALAAGPLLAAMAMLTAVPAQADQNLMVADNGTVRCEASLKDLTRIALRDDKFASVSKVQAGAPNEDIQIINEPIRGDIYLSVPDGFKKPTISFFATTQKGYVYKFVCTAQGEEAQQIFVANADFDATPKAPAVQLGEAMPPREKAARLVKAMYEQAQVEGFVPDWHSLAPVNVGALSVQLVGLYRGKAMVGDMLKVENHSAKPVDLTEEQIAPAGALAVSIVNPKLEPGQATTAYVVEAASPEGVQP